MWTRFMDMHSGGGQKEKWGYIYIEADEEEAKVIFYNRFGHNPERVTCTCCGEDYSIHSNKSLMQLSGYDRGCACLETPKNKKGAYVKPKDTWFDEHYYLEPTEEKEAKKRGYIISRFPRFNKYTTLDEYIKNKSVLVIHSKDIKPKERKGEVPEQGYVWVE